MSDNDLICHWCRGEVTIDKSWRGDRYWAMCRNPECEAAGPTRKTPKEAVEAWQSAINRNELLPVLDEISRLQNKFDDWEGELIEAAVKDIAKRANEQIDAMNSVQRRQSSAESEADELPRSGR